MDSPVNTESSVADEKEGVRRPCLNPSAMVHRRNLPVHSSEIPLTEEVPKVRPYFERQAQLKLRKSPDHPPAMGGFGAAGVQYASSADTATVTRSPVITSRNTLAARSKSAAVTSRCVHARMRCGPVAYTLTFRSRN